MSQDETASQPEEAGLARRMAVREFLAAALYLALVLWAVLVGVPIDDVPPDSTLVPVMLGTSIGLVLAHWLAFRLASYVTDHGFRAATAVREATAQIAGGLATAVLAVIPVLVFDGDTGIQVAVVVLASLPGLTGLAIARLQGKSWTSAFLLAAIVIAVALAVVVVKAALGH